MTDVDSQLGTSLRLARLDDRKTLTDVQQQTGLGTSYLSQLETGRISRPGAEKLALLAHAYGVSYDLLMVLAQHTPRNEARLLANLPLFIIEAGQVLVPEEWDALRTLVGYLVRKKLASPERSSPDTFTTAPDE